MEHRESVGKYRIARKLGQGGMGSVYEAVDEKIRSHVAIKILNPECSQNVQVVMRFLNEAQIANSIRHPGIVKVFDHGFLPTGEAFLAMELLSGCSLRERMRQGCSEADAVRWARQTASALAAAHELGVVHRDLKPDNLMLVADPEVAGGERIKVLDFGIARITRPGNFGEPSRMTATGMLIGTPSYMAPEQCNSAKTTDEKADVYALGIILYEALTGEPPFSSRPLSGVRAGAVADTPGEPGQALIEILFHHLHTPPPPIRERQPRVSLALGTLIHRMLAKSPRERPTMRELLQQLDALEKSASASVQAVATAAQQRTPTSFCEAEKRSVPSHPPRPTHHAKVALLAAGVCLAVLVGFSVRRPATSASVGVVGPAVSLPVRISAPPAAAATSQVPASPEPTVAVAPPPEKGSGSAPSPKRVGKRALAVQKRSRTQRLASPSLSPSQISEQLQHAQALLSRGQAGETLRLALNLEAMPKGLSAAQTQEVLSLLGRAACLNNNIQEACRAHTGLTASFHRRLIESFCHKSRLQCPASNHSALCDELRELDKGTAPAFPTTLRDPFPGRPRGPMGTDSRPPT